MISVFSRKRLTGFQHPVWLSSMIFSLGALMPRAAADVSGSSFVTALDTHTFDRKTKEGMRDWLVIFCDDASQPCKHMTESFKKLTTMWKGAGNFPEAHFGEVSCSQDAHLCEREGVKAFPAAVHYRSGMRTASWRAVDEKRSAVFQFLAWIKNELTPAKQEEEPSSDAAAESFSLLAPFAGMDDETAAVGWCLVLGVILTLMWVVVDGFELWPAAAGKK